MENLKQDQLDQYRDVFSCIDKQGKGYIDKDSLTKHCELLGMSEEHVDDMIKETGSDVNIVSLEDFMTCMSNNTEFCNSSLESAEAFSVFDFDDDGLIDIDDLRHILTRLMSTPVTEQELAMVIKEAEKLGSPENCIDQVTLLKIIKTTFK